MAVSKQFAFNFSEYYRKKDYGEITEMTIERVKQFNLMGFVCYPNKNNV